MSMNTGVSIVPRWFRIISGERMESVIAWIIKEQQFNEVEQSKRQDEEISLIHLKEKSASIVCNDCSMSCKDKIASPRLNELGRLHAARYSIQPIILSSTKMPAISSVFYIPLSNFSCGWWIASMKANKATLKVSRAKHDETPWSNTKIENDCLPQWEETASFVHFTKDLRWSFERIFAQVFIHTPPNKHEKNRRVLAINLSSIRSHRYNRSKWKGYGDQEKKRIKTDTTWKRAIRDRCIAAVHVGIFASTIGIWFGTTNQPITNVFLEARQLRKRNVKSNSLHTRMTKARCASILREISWQRERSRHVQRESDVPQNGPWTQTQK